ncbi:MAG TPA: hypothetical protein VKF61_11235 [Candidatus Polarisedimenticolia bacterium]|nr:hypothetical protein [Candidatus Polarisedimenticolia bacterium]
MNTGRGRALAILTLAAAALLVVSCSRSGGGESPAAQATPASPAASPSPAAEPAKPAESASQDSGTLAPELRPENAAGAVKGVPASTNTAPIVAIANYFTDLPGVDIAGLKPGQKERFLQRVNSEICSCGCKNDTLAHCYVNDPHCRAVKGLVQKVYDEVKTAR